MPRKEFEAFTRLDASDVNTFLMDQSVMTFASAAARGSAIATPVEGMYTHLNDTDQLEFWNGAAWLPPSGLTLINTTSFTAQTQVDITNCFSAAYDNYRIVVTANIPDAVASGLRGRLLSGSTPVTTNYSSNQVNYNMGGPAFLNISADTTQFLLGWVPFTADAHLSSFDVARPFLDQRTAVTGSYSGDASNAYAAFGFYVGKQQNATSYNGFRLIATASTFTGTIRVYGYRNA
jgi:hypothetical protein